jgi:hypothetical protein
MTAAVTASAPPTQRTGDALRRSCVRARSPGARTARITVCRSRRRVGSANGSAPSSPPGTCEGSTTPKLDDLFLDGSDSVTTTTMPSRSSPVRPDDA